MTATHVTTVSTNSTGDLDENFREEWAPFESDSGTLVILLGCQRSGTTLLHLQLARTGAFRYLTAYDVTAADRLVYNHRNGFRDAARAQISRLLDDQAIDRGIDSIPVGPDTPEEYGLAIANTTGPQIRYDQPDTTETTLPSLRELCAKKTLLEGGDRPLLLKSPPDYPGGIGLLAHAFPQARFIAIHRHPLRTLESQVRAWRAAIRKTNPYLALVDAGYRALMQDPGRRMSIGMFLHSKTGVDWLAESILRANLGFLEIAGALEGRLVTLSYEDLCLDQHSEFQRLSAFLGIGLHEPTEQPAPTGRAISEESRAAFLNRAGRFAPFLQHCGYKVEPE